MYDFYPLYWRLCQPFYWGCVKIKPFLKSCFLEYKRHRFLISEPSVPTQNKWRKISVYTYCSLICYVRCSKYKYHMRLMYFCNELGLLFHLICDYSWNAYPSVFPRQFQKGAAPCLPFHRMNSALVALHSKIAPFLPFSKKIWSVSTGLSEHLFAVRHLNKFETANISIYKQNKSNI